MKWTFLYGAACLIVQYDLQSKPPIVVQLRDFVIFQ